MSDDKFLCYACDGYECNEVFAVRNLCGDLAQEENDEEQRDNQMLCKRCINREVVSQRISLWRPRSRRKDSSDSSDPLILFYTCSSDENAYEQRLELEALGSMYPSELTILRDAPSSSAQPCALIVSLIYLFIFTNIWPLKFFAYSENQGTIDGIINRVAE